jgi:hypothetical protein
VADPLWRRSRSLRLAGYFLFASPLLWFGLYEGLILLMLIGFVVEFACFPGK